MPYSLVLLSPWATRCGIAEYSRNLLGAFDPGVSLRVYCDTRTAPDLRQTLFRPAWDIGDTSGVCAVLDEIARDAPDVLLVQHQPSLFRLEPGLCRRLATIHDGGSSVVLELHATRPLAREVELAREAVAALRRLDRIVVHQPADLAQLRAIGLEENLLLLPHGAVAPLPEPANIAAREAFGIDSGDLVLGSFGFALPHKGIDTLVASIAPLAAASGRPVRLLGLNSILEIPGARSRAALEHCRQLGRELGVEDRIVWINDYRPLDECLRILGMADYLVFPYRENPESASGAVSVGLATLKPVLVSPQDIFSDVADCTRRLAGTNVGDIVDAVHALEDDPHEARELLARQRNWLAERNWSHISARMYQLLRELASARASAANAGAQPAQVAHGGGATDGNGFAAGFGVNLFGQFTSATGLGVTVRHTARALRAAGVPFACFDLKAYYPTGDVAAELADIADALTGDPADLRFPVNLYCMPATEFPQLLRTLPRQPGQPRFHAAVVWWETTRLHASWAQALVKLDALVSYSEFLAGVLANSLPLTPVVTGHQPLFLPDGIRPDRSAWGLPQQATLFVSSFDPSSDPVRKNPLAVIQAFRHAFPAREQAVRLAVRLNNADATDMARQTTRLLVEAAAPDPRIVFLLDPMQYREVLALYASADVHVSLHRAEGLGLGMLESMRLGIPVIATAWSGNMTFMDHRSAKLVRYRLMRVSGNHPFYKPEVLGPEAVWADPVIEDAVAWMRLLHSDPLERRRLGERARRRAERYQEEALALDWLRELAELWRSQGRLPRVDDKLGSAGNPQ